MKRTLLHVVAAVFLGVLIVVTPLLVWSGPGVLYREAERALPRPMKEGYEEARDYPSLLHPRNLEYLGLLIGIASALALVVSLYARTLLK